MNESNRGNLEVHDVVNSAGLELHDIVSSADLINID
jgi:hypothetical protein